MGAYVMTLETPFGTFKGNRKDISKVIKLHDNLIILSLCKEMYDEALNHVEVIIMRNDNVDELFCRCKTIKKQRLSDKQAKSRYINYHSMPFFPYDTKRKEFVFDADHNLLAEMERKANIILMKAPIDMQGLLC